MSTPTASTATTSKRSKQTKPPKAASAQNLGTLISSYITSVGNNTKVNNRQTSSSNRSKAEARTSSDRKSSISNDVPNDVVNDAPGDVLKDAGNVLPDNVTYDDPIDVSPNDVSNYSPHDVSNDDPNVLSSDVLKDASDPDDQFNNSVHNEELVPVEPDPDQVEDVVEEEDVPIVIKDEPVSVQEIKAVRKRDDHPASLNYESILKFIKKGKFAHEWSIPRMEQTKLYSKYNKAYVVKYQSKFDGLCLVWLDLSFGRVLVTSVFGSYRNVYAAV